MDSSLDTSVLKVSKPHKKAVVEEERSVGEQHKENASVTKHSPAAVSKEAEKKTLPPKGFDCFMITDFLSHIVLF